MLFNFKYDDFFDWVDDSSNDVDEWKAKPGAPERIKEVLQKYKDACNRINKIDIEPPDED